MNAQSALSYTDQNEYILEELQQLPHENTLKPLHINSNFSPSKEDLHEKKITSPYESQLSPGQAYFQLVITNPKKNNSRNNSDTLTKSNEYRKSQEFKPVLTENNRGSRLGKNEGEKKETIETEEGTKKTLD